VMQVSAFEPSRFFQLGGLKAETSVELVPGTSQIVAILSKSLSFR
jgi:hypothetical protein